jgi:hypothetical protein
MIPSEQKQKEGFSDLAVLLKEELSFSARTFFAPAIAIFRAFEKQFHEAEKIKY